MRWENIVGHEGEYQVSDEGQIRKGTGRIIGQWRSDQGYMLARLAKPRQTVRVHRVVAEAFVPNPRQLPFINHLDCDKTNNSWRNLEWCTQWDNLNHSQQLGRMQRNYWKGKRSPNAYLSESMVDTIRKEYAKGEVSWESLGRKHDVNKRTIGRIVRRESYV